MNERAFRFDLLIAISALFISAIAAFASVYQTRAIQDQYSATIWPYISLDETAEVRGSGSILAMELTLTNDGLGPALVRGAVLSFDGHPAKAWSDLRNALLRDSGVTDRKAAARFPAHMASLDAATTIRPGDSHRIFALKLAKPVPLSTIAKHNVALDVCYCSLNDRCWQVHGAMARTVNTVPTPVAHCDPTEHVDSSDD